jgi:hypothetical protein
MNVLKCLVASLALAAASQVPASAETYQKITWFKAPYAYGLLGSAACVKSDAKMINRLVSEILTLAQSDAKPAKADGEAYCAALTKAFPIDAKRATAILERAEAANFTYPKIESIADGGDVSAQGLEGAEISINLLVIKVKIAFGPKKPADSEGHDGSGKDQGDGEGTAEDGEEPSDTPPAGGGK